MLYSHVVKSDRGFAPNPYGGILTLACCKPRIRATAQAGDWILGTHRTAVCSTAVCYLGRVSEVLSFDAYYRGQRFESKLGSTTGDGDNIYYRDQMGVLRQRRNRHHAPEDLVHDTQSDRVLVCEDFWYFGENWPMLPLSIAASVIKRGPGHKKVADVQTLRELLTFVERFPGGQTGDPIDALGVASCRGVQPQRDKSQQTC